MGANWNFILLASLQSPVLSPRPPHGTLPDGAADVLAWLATRDQALTIDDLR
jgi:hypothetical protein